jgi:lipopolysaccharide biosynthesis regulator YciM
VTKTRRIKAVKKRKIEKTEGLNPLLVMALNLSLLLVCSIVFGVENYFYFKKRLQRMSSLAIAEEKSTTKASLSQAKMEEFDDAYRAAVQNINAYVKDPVRNRMALNLAKAKLNIAMNQLDGDGFDKLREALNGLMKKVEDFEAENMLQDDEEVAP